jgi:hypothetical protein
LKGIENKIENPKGEKVREGGEGGIGIVQKVEHIRKDNDEQTYI